MKKLTAIGPICFEQNITCKIEFFLAVAERVLSQGSITVFGVKLLISRHDNPWDGKTVFVSGKF